MTYIIYTAIVVFTILASTLIGYIVPMTYREKKFAEFWGKCPECEKKKKKNELYNPISFWRYGGYCKKHRVSPYKNILFTVLFTVISLLPFVAEFFMRGRVFSIDSITAYIVAMMLVYLTATDIKGLVIPDFCHIVIALVGLTTMFYSAISTGDTSVYWSRLIGTFSFSLVFFLFCLGGKMGFGDVKLFAVLGLLLGWKKLLLVFSIAVIIGLIYVLFKLITAKNVKWKSTLPFGPFICIGTYITLIGGEEIITAYLNLF